MQSTLNHLNPLINAKISTFYRQTHSLHCRMAIHQASARQSAPSSRQRAQAQAYACSQEVSALGAYMAVQ